MKRFRVVAFMLLVWLAFGAPSARAQVCRPAAGTCDVAESWTAAPVNPGQAMYQPTDGVLYTNVTGDYTAGYAFTPSKTLTVTSLGGLFSGTKTVYLFNRSTGAVLASASVTAANNWSYTPISPITLTAGTSYTVAVYLPGTGGAYRASLSSMPSVLADASLEGSCYRAASGVEPCASSGLLASGNYGMADFKYLVAHPLYQPTDGTLYTNVPGDYVVGYAFKPNKTLTVTSLGGLFDGTRTVYLFNRTTGAVLASASVTAANNWSYTPISPVTLTAGTSYTVAVYLPGTGGAYRAGLSSMPSVLADASLEGSCYRPSSTAEPCASSGLLQGANYGMADLQYTPTGGGLFCPADSFLSASTVCRAAADTCDVAEKCTGSAAACPTDVFAPVSTSCTGSSPNPLAIPLHDPIHASASATMESLAANLEAEDPEASPPTPPVSRSAPVWVTYSFFFSHLGFLEREAEKEEARGDLQAAIDWRHHEQLAAGLDGRQGALLKQVAAECLAAVEAKDEEIQKGLQAFREEHPDGAFTQAHLPPELKALWQERIDIIERQIRRLQSLLGDDFHKLDSYIRANFVPVVVELGQDAAEGGVQ